MTPLLCKKQVADALGLSVRSVDRLVSSGALKAVRVLGRVRFSADDLSSFITNQKTLKGEKP